MLGNRINTNTRQLRDADTIKLIISKYIKRGNRIVSDGWMGYRWLSSNDSGYSHIVHIHSHGYFGYGA